jgi:hypothetical protein
MATWLKIPDLTNICPFGLSIVSRLPQLQSEIRVWLGENLEISKWSTILEMTMFYVHKVPTYVRPKQDPENDEIRPYIAEATTYLQCIH